MTAAIARTNASPYGPVDRPRGERILAGVIVTSVGLSVANAAGRIGYGLFLAVCVALSVRGPRGLLLRPLVRPLALALFAGALGVLASLQATPSLAPLTAFARPVLEGYLVATTLYCACRIRSLSALVRILAGYLALELAAAALMVAMPSLRLQLLDTWYSDESYQIATVQAALLFRGFGISRHHLYGLPLALGTAAALVLVHAEPDARERSRRWAPAIAILVIPVVAVNARIGLVPVLLTYALGVTVFFRARFLRQLLVVLPATIVAVFVAARAFLGDALDVVLTWLLEGVLQFTNPDAAADSTTVTDLRAMVVLPRTFLAWTVGEGRICEPGEYCYSDIGWIRLLQQGGLALTTVVAIVYWTAVRRTFSDDAFREEQDSPSTDRESRRLLSWILIGTFLAASVKGDAFGVNDYSRLVMLLFFLARLTSRSGGRASGSVGTPSVCREDL